MALPESEELQFQIIPADDEVTVIVKYRGPVALAEKFVQEIKTAKARYFKRRGK